MTQDVVERLEELAKHGWLTKDETAAVKAAASEITRLRELSRDGGQEPVARSAVIKICQDVADTAIDYVLSGDPENSRNRESMEAAAVRIRDAVALLPSLYASTEGAVVGWIRGVKGASTPWDPGEWNVDYVHGDCPPGDGWTPLYASPSPSPDEVDEWREIVRELLPYAIANPTNEGGITIRERAARMLGGQCSKCGGVPDDHIANYYCPEFVAEAPVPSRVASPDRDAIIEMCAEAADHCCGAGSSYIAAYIRSLKSSHVTGEDR
jgi:hypothetical protein